MARLSLLLRPSRYRESPLSELQRVDTFRFDGLDPHLSDLILATFLAAAFTLTLKHCHAFRLNLLTIGCWNYVVAAAASVIWAAPQLSWAMPNESLVYGSIGGLMYVLTFLAMTLLLDRHGISTAAAVVRISILVPIVVSIWAWDEIPTTVQWIGLVLALAALWQFRQESQAGGRPHAWQIWLPLLGCFLSNGLARLCQKAGAETCGLAGLPSFLAFWYVSSAIVAIGLLAVRRVRPRGGEWILGGFLGLINAGGLIFAVRGLSRFESVVFFPVAAIGGLALVVAVARTVYSERLSPRTWVGLAISCIALSLIGVGSN
jgi:uncharacterized membrane protein